MRSVLLVEQSLAYTFIGIDAAVAQERPVLPLLLDQAEVALDDQQLFAVPRRLAEDLA